MWLGSMSRPRFGWSSAASTFSVVGVLYTYWPTWALKQRVTPYCFARSASFPSESMTGW
jgi:hypothetical protein